MCQVCESQPRDDTCDGKARLRWNHADPADELKGNLYYVRLKTSLGPMYKLGFTTMASVKERFAFQRAGHGDQIDKVIAFVPDTGALLIEQRLHRHFTRHSVFSIIERDMLFAGNGQSELYVEDILQMDFEYTPERGQRVHEALMQGRMAQAGASPASMLPLPSKSFATMRPSKRSRICVRSG